MNRFALMICILFSNWALAQENVSVTEQSICLQILEEQPESVLFVTENKLYVRPEMIIPTHQGLFLGNAHSPIAIPVVFADSFGCYLPYGSLRGQDYLFCTKPSCGTVWRGHPGSRCPKCGSPGTS